MASVLDRYGIKEVADVTFYQLSDTGKPEYPVLYLDTLKVSTIEQTAEEAEARGGKGNPALIMWDYNKEINVTLEDALFSAKSLAIMFGDGNTRHITAAKAGDSFVSGSKVLMFTEVFTATSSGALEDCGWTKDKVVGGKKITKLNPKIYNAAGSSISPTELVQDTKYFCTYDVVVNNNSDTVIEISANSFPGTYYVVGDTYARSNTSGKDEFFQFIIPKAKVTSENTITLEAEGDPSVFNMNLRVLRPDDGVMMKLVKYDMGEPADIGGAETVGVYHNHILTGFNGYDPEA